VTDPLYVDSTGSGKDVRRFATFSNIKSTPVYLPAGVEWYDFWTGARSAGGQTVQKQAAIDVIPLYVKAGSILPIGPKVKYAEEKKWDNLEVRVYPGADGGFTLYEDENDNYDYEKGIHSTITVCWDDAKKVLTIGDRTGSFPGMLKDRTFNIVFVSGSKGVGMAPVDTYDKVVAYNGKEVVVKR
jgi:alpha-D-xyloside xylohydrolase